MNPFQAGQPGPQISNRKPVVSTAVEHTFFHPLRLRPLWEAARPIHAPPRTRAVQPLRPANTFSKHWRAWAANDAKNSSAMMSPVIRVLGLLLLIWLTGCATPRNHSPALDRGFQFQTDTLAYPNELVWEYTPDPATGKMVTRKREPPPTYALRCFAVARHAKQFFLHARFAPEQPKLNSDGYRRLIDSDKIVIPGYADLRAFSADYEAVLKAASGGAWHSYFQRGNWRMVFPFSRAHRERMAAQLRESLQKNWPPVVHIVRFPDLAINHVLLLFDCKTTAQGLEFAVYDPNDPDNATRLEFDRARREFYFPSTRYFQGGTVNVYEIYHSWNY
jgi:hypothetical protein